MQPFNTKLLVGRPMVSAKVFDQKLQRKPAQVSRSKLAIALKKNGIA